MEIVSPFLNDKTAFTGHLFSIQISAGANWLQAVHGYSSIVWPRSIVLLVSRGPLSRRTFYYFISKSNYLVSFSFQHSFISFVQFHFRYD